MHACPNLFAAGEVYSFTFQDLPLPSCPDQAQLTVLQKPFNRAGEVPE